MIDKNIFLKNSHIKKLTKKIDFYSEEGKIELTFRKSSNFVYERILHSFSKSIEEKLNDERFYDYLYFGLALWQMDGRGATLNYFDEFKKSIVDNKKVIIELSKYKLNKLNDEKYESIKNELLTLFNNLKVVGINPRTNKLQKRTIVANSKLMHFLLPNLVPPMDTAYTEKFFKRIKVTWGGSDEKQFTNCMYYFHILCSTTNKSPKEIDDAIIGYCKRHFVEK